MVLLLSEITHSIIRSNVHVIYLVSPVLSSDLFHLSMKNCESFHCDIFNCQPWPCPISNNWKLTIGGPEIGGL